jgi:hypothetical protein
MGFKPDFDRIHRFPARSSPKHFWPGPQPGDRVRTNCRLPCRPRDHVRGWIHQLDGPLEGQPPQHSRRYWFAHGLHRVCRGCIQRDGRCFRFWQPPPPRGTLFWAMAGCRSHGRGSSHRNWFPAASALFKNQTLNLRSFLLTKQGDLCYIYFQ